MESAAFPTWPQANPHLLNPGNVAALAAVPNKRNISRRRTPCPAINISIPGLDVAHLSAGLQHRLYRSISGRLGKKLDRVIDQLCGRLVWISWRVVLD